MRLRIVHETRFSYETPATRAIQTLRLSPRGHDGQYVANWRIDVDRDCRLDAATDPFGNTVHSFSVDGPLSGLVVTAEGEVETSDTQGVVRDQIERFPPAVFLRDTALTASDAAVRAAADDIGARFGADRLTLLHNLMGAVHERLTFDVAEIGTGVGAAAAFAAGHGVCQDFAHVFIAAARHLGVPARYVTGYVLRGEDVRGQETGHGWAEALVEDIGWIGFDAANDLCPTDAYVRLAIGLDYLSAAPIRGASYGSGSETFVVQVRVSEIGRHGR